MSTDGAEVGGRQQPKATPSTGSDHREDSAVTAASVTQTHPRAGRGVFALVICGVLAIGLLAMLAINTSLASGAFALTDAKRTQAVLGEQAQALAQIVAEQGTPARLQQRAEDLGMVATRTPVFLRLRDGAVLGEPEPAVAATAAALPAASAPATPANVSAPTATPTVAPSASPGDAPAAAAAPPKAAPTQAAPAKAPAAPLPAEARPDAPVSDGAMVGEARPDAPTGPPPSPPKPTKPTKPTTPTTPALPATPAPAGDGAVVLDPAPRTPVGSQP